MVLGIWNNALGFVSWKQIVLDYKSKTLWFGMAYPDQRLTLILNSTNEIQFIRDRLSSTQKVLLGRGLPLPGFFQYRQCGWDR